MLQVTGDIDPLQLAVAALEPRRPATAAWRGDGGPGVWMSQLVRTLTSERRAEAHPHAV